MLIGLLTWSNTRGIQYGKVVQNIFTSTKIVALLGVIGLGLFVGWSVQALRTNFNHMWAPHDYTPIVHGLSPQTVFGLFVALAVAQVGSLFAADAWNNITFTAGEVKAPHRNVPLSLALGTFLVIALYTLANLAYVVVLPLERVQHAPSDRVAGAMLQAVFPDRGASIMALAIMVSSFGCINGMLMSGARAYFAMARDGLFFRRAAVLNQARVPGPSLAMQGAWATLLVLIRTYDSSKFSYGNLYSNLLDYVVSAALLFYLLTIAAVFRLRFLRPEVQRPYRAFGYPVVPAVYLLSAAAILGVLFVYRPTTTFPGMVIVLIGVPVYFALRWSTKKTQGASKEGILSHESHR
jgi:APA family basic amino acid/polyamine antiporter